MFSIAENFMEWSIKNVFDTWTTQSNVDVIQEKYKYKMYTRKSGIYRKFNLKFKTVPVNILYLDTFICACAWYITSMS